MTPEERRAGLRRLGMVLAGLVLGALLLALVLVQLGASGRSGLAASVGLEGIGLVLAGVAVFPRTGMLQRANGISRLSTADDRRHAEQLALGLFGLGITCSALALALG